MRKVSIIVEPRKGLSHQESTRRHALMRDRSPLTHPKLWMTREQAAEYLDISLRSIDRHRTEGRLGYYRGPVPGFDAALRLWTTDVEGLKVMRNGSR